MNVLRVKIEIERLHAMQDWGQDLLGSVVNFDTGEPIPYLQSFKLTARIGGAIGITGPLPHFAELQGEITYRDPTESGKKITQYVQVTEMTIRTVKKS
jgi:hypothetical protein